MAIYRVLRQWFTDIRTANLEAIESAYRPGDPRAKHDAGDMGELLALNPDWRFSLLSVAWTDEAAMAVSGKLAHGDPKAGREPVVLVWHLKKLDGRWVIDDIDLEQIQGLQRENAHFLRNHRGAEVWYREPQAGFSAALPLDQGIRYGAPHI